MRNFLLTLSITILFQSCCENVSSKTQQGEAFLEAIGYSKEDESYKMLKSAIHFYFSTTDNITEEEIANADAIFAFAFGQGKGNPPTPGGSNEGLAEVCKQLYNLSGDRLPIFAQWEIADVLQERYNLTTTCKAVVKGEYLSTIGVLDQFKEYIESHGHVKTVLVVAQRDHAFRAIKLVEKQGFNVLVGENCFSPNTGWEQYKCDEWGYYPLSSQPWTTNRGIFLSHELSSVNNALFSGAIDY